MHQKVSNPIFDFNFIKILFPKFKFPQNAKLVTFSYFQKHEKFRVLHVCHGAAMVLAAAQAHSGHELWLLPHGFPAAAHPGDHERLVEDFFDAANSALLLRPMI